MRAGRGDTARRVVSASVVVALSVGVVACATVTSSAPTVPMELSDAGAPRPVAGYDWFLNTDAGEVKLAFGMADSDDLTLALRCDGGAGRLELTQLVQTATPDIHLESGGETERFAATGEPSGIGNDILLTAQAQAATPVFQRFRKVGWIATWQDGRRETLTPQPGSAAQVERFFALCG